MVTKADGDGDVVKAEDLFKKIIIVVVASNKRLLHEHDIRQWLGRGKLGLLKQMKLSLQQKLASILMVVKVDKIVANVVGLGLHLVYSEFN